MDRAGFATRLAAAFFEGVLYLLLLITEVVLLVAIFLAWEVVEPDEPRPRGMVVTQWAFVVIWHVGLLWLSALEIQLGRGFGKVVVGLQIAATDGGPAAYRALALRWLIKYGWLILLLVLTIPLSLVRGRPMELIDLTSLLTMALLLFAMICFLFALRPTRQALYDQWTGTAVFRRHPATKPTNSAR